jgi:hypothetical protein
VTHEHFASGKLKIRCSASIYDVYWQSTEVSAEEDRPRVIHYEPAATIVGINYLQPPPNFQTGQKKPDGQVGVKGKALLPLKARVFISFLRDAPPIGLGTLGLSRPPRELRSRAGRVGFAYRSLYFPRAETTRRGRRPEIVANSCKGMGRGATHPSRRAFRGGGVLNCPACVRMNFNSDREAGMAGMERGAKAKRNEEKRKRDESGARKRRFLRLVVIRALSRSLVFQYSDPPQ